MRRIILSIAVLAALVSSALAQQPDRPITLTITFAEYSKIWEALGETKLKDTFSVAVKINNQAIQQLSAPPPAPTPPAPTPE